MTRSAPAELPLTWRPFGARIVGTISGVMLVALVLAVWILLGPEERAKYSTFQRGTLVFLGLLAASVWLALMRSRLTASAEGVTVVNGYKRRDLEWAQVVGISLRRGAPWATLDLSDGTVVSVLGIQGSDGQRARDAVGTLRALIASQTAA